MSELKPAAAPCPFCGSPHGYVERISLCSYAYICDCGARGQEVEELRFEMGDDADDGERLAIEAWNRRAEPKSSTSWDIYVAELESDPETKALLDEARVQWRESLARGEKPMEIEVKDIVFVPVKAEPEKVEPAPLVPGLKWAVARCNALRSQGFEHVNIEALKRDFENCMASQESAHEKALSR